MRDVTRLRSRACLCDELRERARYFMWPPAILGGLWCGACEQLESVRFGSYGSCDEEYLDEYVRDSIGCEWLHAVVEVRIPKKE